jgi:hypothetical protein
MGEPADIKSRAWAAQTLRAECVPQAEDRARVRRALGRVLASGQVSSTVSRVDAQMATRAARLAKLGASGASTATWLGLAVAGALLAGLAWFSFMHRPRHDVALASARSADGVAADSERDGLAPNADLGPHLPPTAADEPVPPPVQSPADERVDQAAADQRPGAVPVGVLSAAAAHSDALQHRVTRARSNAAARSADAAGMGIRLGEETALIRRASAALRKNDSEAALASLAEHARLFPNGLLARERRALHVLALCAQGPTPAALQERASYLRTASRSPLSDRVARACAGAGGAAASAATGGAP